MESKACYKCGNNEEHTCPICYWVWVYVEPSTPHNREHEAKRYVLCDVCAVVWTTLDVYQEMGKSFRMMQSRIQNNAYKQTNRG